MRGAYSHELRERVVQAVPHGDSCAVAAGRFDVSKSSAITWLRLFRRTGSVAPGKMGGHRAVLPEPSRDFIIEQPEQVSHPGLSRLQDLLAGRGMKVCHDTVRRFLPPYSPDPNLIEQTFSKVKHWMRMAQKRTIEETWRHVGTLLGTIAAKEGAGYFKNAGYV